MDWQGFPDTQLIYHPLKIPLSCFLLGASHLGSSCVNNEPAVHVSCTSIRIHGELQKEGENVTPKSVEEKSLNPNTLS